MSRSIAKPPGSFDQICGYVENHILSGHYPVGSAVPSVRRLAAKFKAGNTVTQLALHELVHRGLLEARPQRGFFVIRRFPEFYPDRPRRIVVFQKNLLNEGMLIFAMLQGFLESARDGGAAVQIHYLPPTEISFANLKKAVADADGAVLLHSIDREVLPELHLPCPVIGMLAQNVFGGTISAINLDLTETARQAAAFFRSRQISQVEIHSAGDDPYVSRALAFQAVFKLAGGRAKIRKDAPAQLLPAAAGVGYFFSSDSYLEGLARQLPELPWHDPGVAILGVDGKRLLEPDFPLWPTVAVDYREMGRIAYQELMRRIAEPDSAPRQINVFGKLI